jgi:hypothetical protein
MNEQRKAQYVKISPLENAIEAQVLESVLEEAGIPHRIRSYHDTAYDGLFQVQKGWGAIYAPSEFEKEISGILKDIRSRES